MASNFTLLTHFLVSTKQGTLDAEKRLDNNIVDFGPQQANIDAHIFKVALQRGQRPLVAEVLLSRIFVLNEGVTLLVDTIVGQVAKLLLLVRHLVRL